jgi:hypothetical protein
MLVIVYDEKLTEKKHIRLTPALDRQVRALAEIERRPVQDQIRLLIEEALEFRSKGNFVSRRRLLTPADSRRRAEGAA